MHGCSQIWQQQPGILFRPSAWANQTIEITAHAHKLNFEHPSKTINGTQSVCHAENIFQILSMRQTGIRILATQDWTTERPNDLGHHGR